MQLTKAETKVSQAYRVQAAAKAGADDLNSIGHGTGSHIYKTILYKVPKQILYCSYKFVYTLLHAVLQLPWNMDRTTPAP